MRAFIRSFAILLFAIAVVTSKKVHFQDCASQTHGKILYVDATPCDEDPCVFKRGSNETVTVKFIPGEVITSGKLYLYAIRWGMRFSLPLPNPNACEGYGLACPLKSDVPVELAFTQEVSESFPSGSFKLEAVLRDQNGDDVICGIFRLKIA